MKLLRMTATFGRLEQETLSLTEGLNVLQMPNEAGKSTWAEFLLAMLYGVDTSEREKTGVLPVKTKYQPWSGKPMEGVIELEHAGRRITLTRTSTARAPLGVFSAVYTDSGLPVEGMTGANCGETLLGVPKRVYQRSAFVRQAGLGLTPDDELEARLSALVTTGDEAVSFAAADKRLLAWQNRVRHNKTGLIPDAERELAAVDSALAALAGEHEKNLALRAQLQSLQAQQTACEEDLRALRAAFPQTIPVLAGYFVLGLGYGIYVQSLGLPVWMPMLMGTVVYGGSLEFVLASLLLSAFSPLSAFLMALMIQARHLFYGLAMLERYKGYGLRSFYMIFAMSDETFSITCSATPPEGVDKGWFMFFITLLDQLYWVGSAGLGAALGTVLPFSTEGVDFVMTAMFTVIFLNQWEKDQQHGSALIGLAVPLVCLAVFGSGSFLLPSMGGILVLLLALRRPMEKAAGEVEK